MHNKQPPIAHRDIKVENILLQNKKFKLCDFGSASVATLCHQGMSDNAVDEIFESYEKYTTMMYRPPEMIDKYRRLNVSTKVDIWMIGCVAYTLCFAQHPFMESQKLAICQATYNFPQNPSIPASEKMKDLIRLCLIPDPEQRPNITKLLSILDNYLQLPQINLPDGALQVKQRQEQQIAQHQQFQNQLSAGISAASHSMGGSA